MQKELEKIQLALAQIFTYLNNFERRISEIEKQLNIEAVIPCIPASIV